MKKFGIWNGLMTTKKKEMSIVISFTKMDVFNILKYKELRENQTIQAALDSLEMTNSKANHLRICDQILGYVRCMMDMKLIPNGVFNDVALEIRYLRSVLMEGK
jgi:hypothetical protein